MKIGDRIFVRGYIDEIRKDTVIVRNDGGYFGTIPSEVITGELPSAQPETHDKRTETHACDLISRQAAIEAVKKNTFRLTFAEEQNCEGHVAWSADAVYSDVIEGALLELPSAQPERIKGHWIEITLSNHTYKCSVCGRLLVNITDGKNNVAKNYPYCHCGADMRGE